MFYVQVFEKVDAEEFFFCIDRDLTQLHFTQSLNFYEKIKKFLPITAGKIYVSGTLPTKARLASS